MLKVRNGNYYQQKLQNNYFQPKVLLLAQPLGSLGWLVGEVKVTKKIIQTVFLPLMTLVNESLKEFCFRLLEELPQDLCF